MDIVIPYRTSEYDNIELRYCLSSIRKYLIGYNNIFIVGDHPGFEGDYIHIPANDPGFDPQKNIKHKIVVACKDARVSDDFFLTNDDHIFLKPLEITTLPYYYSGDLDLAYKRKRKVGSYKNAIENTKIALEERMFATYYFDIHTPIIYNKAKFINVMSQYDWSRPKWEFVIKSLYCNTLMIPGVHFPDMMIGYPPTGKGQVYDSIINRPFFAFNEQALCDPAGTMNPNAVMIEVLQELAPL